MQLTLMWERATEYATFRDDTHLQKSHAPEPFVMRGQTVLTIGHQLIHITAFTLIQTPPPHLLPQHV